MKEDSYIKIHDVNVIGINTAQRSQGLKQFVLRGCGKHQPAPDFHIPILNNINFEAKKGDRIGFIGHNGCGKSSLLKVIAGIYPPHSGTVDIRGRVAPVIEMGVGFNEAVSGRQNIKLGLIYSNRLAEYSKELEEEIIEFSGLREKIDIPLKYYSSGMRGRLAFSIAAFQNPDILLLDEVFAAGDAEFVEKSHSLMVKKFTSVDISILVSHAREIILGVCNRCIAMHNGRIVDDGAPEEIIKNYEEGKYSHENN